MRFHCFLIFIIIVLASYFKVDAQATYKQLREELKSLDKGKYVSKAFAGAKILALEGDYKNSLDLMNRGIKESRSLGSSAKVIVYFNKAELLVRYFTRTEKYDKELLESIKKFSESNPPNDRIEQAISLVESVISKVNKKLQPKFNERLEALKIIIPQRELAKNQEIQEQKLMEFRAMGDERAMLTLEQLQAEREKLEMDKLKLAGAIDSKNSQLNKRASIINSMSREQAKNEAIIQYNKRMIDSLEFQSEIDSVIMLSNQYLIDQQEASIQLKDSEIQLKNSQRKFFLALSLIGLLLAGFLFWMFYSTRRSNKQLALKNEEILKEKQRSEKLLLNILPSFIAQELKENSKVQTRLISQCSVIFVDFINFSSIAKKLSPHDLIASLDECFRAFDQIIGKYNIEKIKTIGDAYMCAGGVPVPNTTHAIDAVNSAFEMVRFIDAWNVRREKEKAVKFEARIGIHSGPIIAGVVGIRKFSYDIWGDTVNVASRIEAKSAASKINISESTYQLIKDQFNCIKRGSISVKNMPDLEMYFVDENIKFS